MSAIEALKAWLSEDHDLFNEGVDEVSLYSAIVAKARDFGLHPSKVALSGSSTRLTVRCNFVDAQGAMRAVTISRQVPCKN